MSRVARVLLCILGVLVASAAVVLLADGAVSTARGQRLDELALRGGTADEGPLTGVVFPALDTVTIPVVVIALLAAAVLALLRRRYRVIVQIALLTFGANITTQVVKGLVLDRTALADQVAVTPNSFPSGHMTLAASVAVAVTVAVPQGVRSLTGILGVAWTAAAGTGTIALGWHRPSDAIGALLVVGAWSCLVLMVEPRPTPSSPDQKRPRHSGATGALLLGAVTVVAAVGLVLALLALPTPLRLSDAGDQSLAYGASALAMIAGSAAVMTVVLLLRAPDPQRAHPVERVP